MPPNIAPTEAPLCPVAAGPLAHALDNRLDHAHQHTRLDRLHARPLRRSLSCPLLGSPLAHHRSPRAEGSDLEA
eukprot:4586839-Pleurochrysis_carterae.AAC.2